MGGKRSIRQTNSSSSSGHASSSAAARRSSLIPTMSTDREDVIIPLLARRSCHLPGNTWKQDWVQYMRNNHIVFGICLCHPLHPLEWWERIMALIGSIAVGLIATNIAYLWYDLNNNEQFSDSVVHLTSDFVITKGMIFLWTFGAVVHSVYDLVIWHVMACACCHPGGRYGNHKYAPRVKDCGSYILIPVVLALAALATLSVMRRASNENSASDFAGANDDQAATTTTTTSDSLFSYQIDGVHSFSFLSKYAIELALTWFVYFPIFGTVLFSGIFGCGGRLPVLGGRPRDVKLYQESLLKNEQEGDMYASF